MPVQYIRIDYGVSIFQEFVVFRVTKTSQFSQANLIMLNLISNYFESYNVAEINWLRNEYHTLYLV